MNYYKYLDDRDFILIEQRGNYYADPHLDCPEWAKALRLSNISNDSARNDSLLLNAAKDCKKRLTTSGIDLNGYNTKEIAADINDLVEVLGIKEYNLLTISYSTKIAQVLIRDYPERIRSVVMDSPLPLEVNYDEESIINLLESVEKLLDDCQADENCKYAFPDLKNRFLQYLKDKTNTPLQVDIKDPITSQNKTFHLRGADFISVFTSASTDGVHEIPFEINKVLSGDLSSVKEELRSLFAEPGSGAGMGMRLSVWCAEENPFSSQDIIESETNIHPEVKGMSPAVFDDSICKVWGVNKVGDIENQPITTEIPILLISGEYDNETPPKWARSMMDNLQNSHHLIFEGWKHTPTTNWSNQCAMVAANEFFNSPEVKPNPACLEQINTPDFKIAN